LTTIKQNMAIMKYLSIVVLLEPTISDSDRTLCELCHAARLTKVA